MNVTRRTFMRKATSACAAIAIPTIVPSGMFGKNAPSNRITIGMIGMGRQACYSNLPYFLHDKRTVVTALCDVDSWRLEQAAQKVQSIYENTDCLRFKDWRDLIAREDLDAVMISTPDQWHVPMALEAVRRGKHVCCEKPLTFSIAEGRVLADAAAEKGVVFQTDTECRADMHMHKTAEIALNGYLGTIRRMEVGVPKADAAGGDPTPQPEPAELDYALWTGPAPLHPYTVDRVHPRQSFNRPGWMRCRTTCAGVITNWGTHLLDVAQIINRTQRTGPISVEGTGFYPPSGSGLWDVLTGFQVRYRYANDVVVDYHTAPEPFIRVEGDTAWFEAKWGKGLSASAPALIRLRVKETDERLCRREDKDDFLYAIQNSVGAQIDAEVGHRTCSMCQIAEIAIKRGHKLDWDPKAEQFPNDQEANQMRYAGYRLPWDAYALRPQSYQPW
jgi:myo-inositol 2-dehydrogenase / D-chiro-inositol 1-dehydrogenase